MARTKFERKLQGWQNAPVPPCSGGDYRGLTWCCKPGYPLMNAGACLRDEYLTEIGMSQKQFIAIKEDFSKKNGLYSESPCFKSLTYCCMHRNGCSMRDAAIEETIGSLEDYYRIKSQLSKEILEKAPRQDKVNHLLNPENFQ